MHYLLQSKNEYYYCHHNSPWMITCVCVCMYVCVCMCVCIVDLMMDTYTVGCVQVRWRSPTCRNIILYQQFIKYSSTEVFVSQFLPPQHLKPSSVNFSQMTPLRTTLLYYYHCSGCSQNDYD